ncbi:Dityrosine transporter 1 [Coccidioides posadasii str. Silveira]|nr:Dityrosine transporter 1 [Coccidioides posadasii str. Silveira]
MPRLQTKCVVDQQQFPRPPRPTVKTFIRLLRYPPHFIVSVNGALSFAGLYAIYVTFPAVWEQDYGYSSSEVGYLYLVPGISLLIASVCTGRFSDYRRAKLLAAARQSGKTVVPEQRISLQIYGFIITAAGKAMYGWFTRHHIHASAGLVGSGIAAVGTAIVFVTSTSFQTECDPSQAASLVALAGLVRNIAAAIAAVIVEKIVVQIGYGWCFTGLAVLDALCVAGVLVIIWKGQLFRERRQRSMENRT